MASDRKIARIESAIHVLRGQRVMLDSDLAAIYGTSTMRLNEQFKQNRKRFPNDFAFVLTRDEFTNLISQNAISKRARVAQTFCFCASGFRNPQSAIRNPKF